VLRYVGVIDVKSKTARVELRRYDESHPFAGLRGSDNIIRIVSERWSQGLVIQGAGAGKDATVAGILADMHRIRECVAYAKQQK